MGIEKRTGAITEADVQARMQEIGEAVISQLLRFARMKIHHPTAADSFVRTLDRQMGEKTLGLLPAAVDEMAAVLSNSEENRSGYHLNCVHSGTSVYAVQVFSSDDDDEDADDEDCYFEFKRKEDAEAKAAEYKYAEVFELDPAALWAVLNDQNKNEDYRMYYTQSDAVFALYKKARPEAFVRYLMKNPIIGSETADEEDENDG